MTIGGTPLQWDLGMNTRVVIEYKGGSIVGYIRCMAVPSQDEVCIIQSVPLGHLLFKGLDFRFKRRTILDPVMFHFIDIVDSDRSFVFVPIRQQKVRA